MKFNQSLSNMVKGVAIILMLMHHLFGCATMFCEEYEVAAAPFLWDNIYSFSMNAKVCVGMFVFITAFGITRQYNKQLQKQSGKVLNKKQIEEFSIHRYKKLALNFGFIYIIAVLTVFLREGGLNGVYNKSGIKKAIMYGSFDALGLANYFGTPSLNETWWYMSIAIFMIFLIPIMIKIYKENGILLVIISGFLFYFGITRTSFIQYVFGISIGILCAEENVLEKMYEISIFKSKILHFLSKIIVYILVLSCLFWIRGKTSYSYWIDPVFAVFVGALCMEMYSTWKWGAKFLGYLGKHSMNIFLVHTLIFEYYFTDAIYGCRHWWLILFALLISSWAVSCIVEALKQTINGGIIFIRQRKRRQ